MRCHVVESYRDYEPRYPVVPVVEDLIRCVPEKLLAGLDTIVLTNAGGLSRQDRRRRTRSRGRKVVLSERRGFYRSGDDGQMPYIQLHVDLICGPTSKRSWWLAPLMAPFLRRWEFADVLYHELGHHIHHTQHPEHREREKVADGYMRKLLKRMCVRRWYLAVPACGAFLLLLAHPMHLRRILAIVATYRRRGRQGETTRGEGSRD